MPILISAEKSGFFFRGPTGQAIAPEVFFADAFNQSGEIYQSMEEEKHPLYDCHAVNASPGGYCLQLGGEVASRVRTGEILGLREDGNGDWALAIIRWLRRVEGGEVMFGVELLSPMADPLGARILNRKPPSDPMRALLLPEIKLVGQAETLLVPKVGFREGQRVELMHQGDTRNVRLVRQLPLTGSYARFEIQYIADLTGRVRDLQTDLAVDDAYESLWSKL